MLNHSIINLLRLLSDFRNGQGEPIPALFLSGALFTACFSQPVELGSAAGLWRPPIGTNPAALLDPVDRWVERALLNLKQLVR
jgi:hypothetical protein